MSSEFRYVGSDFNASNSGRLAYSGLLLRDDLLCEEVRAIVRELSDRWYVGSKGSSGWWHHWSRVLEYPYAYHAIRSFSSEAGCRPFRILDVACGVSPVPFWLASDGDNVVGIDSDSKYRSTWGRRPLSRQPHGDRLSFIECNAEILPFDDDQFDVAYSVSALEHMGNPIVAVKELCRVVHPGGLVVLTWDVGWQGFGISTRVGIEMMKTLDARSEFLFAPRWAHPSEVLTFGNHANDPRGAIRRGLSRLRQFLRFRSVNYSEIAVYATARIVR